MVTLKNTSSEDMHFPHIGTIPAGGTISVSKEDAEILLRNHDIKREDSPRSTKGVSRDRSMKGIERE